MIVAVQAESIESFKRVVSSDCEKVRFGSEFCDIKLPDFRTLRLAYKLAEEAEKEFSYVTPPISNPTLGKIIENLSFLNGLGPAEVIVNDLGVLRLLRKYQGLEPHLGRLRVYTPGRCPWSQITRMPNVSYFSRRRVEQIFYQTALNYEPTIRFYREMGVQAADVDWIPQSFKHYKELVKHGVNLSVHLHLVPAALTRKCHTARLLEEESFDSCSKPCYSKAYKMENKALKVELFLQGNGVFRIVNPKKREVDQLDRIGVSELVLTMRPVTGIDTAEDIQSVIDDLRS